MKVKDLMTADGLKTCSPETKLTSVAKIMKENNRGALPIVDDDRKVVGIITDRDICLSMAAQNHKNTADLAVKEVLPRHKIHTINTEAEITEALREMRRSRVGRLPVTDGSGRLQGMVSINTLLSRAIRENETIGQLKSKNENLAKTIKALFDRNGSKTSRARKEELEMEASD